MPPNKEFRAKVIDTALKNVMHFVNENMPICNETDREKVEKLLTFAKYTN